MRRIFLILALCMLTGIALFPLGWARADEVSDLQQKIDQRNALVKQLQQEIAAYSSEADKASTQAQTLKDAISSLDLSVKQLGTQIQSTQAQISSASLTINQLDDTIKQHEDKIAAQKAALAESMREQNRNDFISPAETYFESQSIFALTDQLASLGQYQAAIEDHAKQLKTEEDSLQSDLQKKEGEKRSLVTLKAQLTGQQQAISATKKDKSTLLTQTKSKESNYKKLVAQKKQDEAVFEQELFDFENQLKIAIDKSKYPPTQTGVLSWPLDKIIITQLFGKTSDSGRLYASGTHNGVDFGASVGTPVKAALSGTVAGSGNTDAFPGCYSYGKWVMIRHDNGLSSIYAHLSVILATPGQRVSTGDVIGYSGATGYVTGPHLHFGLYATQGVQISIFSSSIGCKKAIVPLAPPNAYLDPMAYFPKQ